MGFFSHTVAHTRGAQAYNTFSVLPLWFRKLLARALMENPDLAEVDDTLAQVEDELRFDKIRDEHGRYVLAFNIQ